MWLFHVVVLLKTAKKWTRVKNARAERTKLLLLFCLFFFFFTKYANLWRSCCSCRCHYLKTFAQKFSNIDFFLQILPLKDDELVMSEMKKNGESPTSCQKCKKNGGSPTSFWRELTRKNTLNLKKSGFFSELGHSVCKPKNIPITSLN